MSLEAYEQAEPWLRGDAGRLVACCVVTCARCGAELARAYRSAYSVEDAARGVFTTSTPWTEAEGRAKLVLACPGCGARPQVSEARLAEAIDAVWTLGRSTGTTLAVS